MASSFLALLVVVLAVGIANLVWDVTPYRQVLHRVKKGDVKVVYGAGTDDFYDASVVEAPVISNPWVLSVMARIFVSSPLGDWLVRGLLNKNKITALIELSSAIQDTDPSLQHEKWFVSGKEYGLGEPLVRLSHEEQEWHIQASASVDSSQPPFQANSNLRRHHRSVRDYHEAYKSQATTPTKVLERLIQFIEQTNETLHCVQEVDYVGARAAAADATQRYAQNKPLSIWDGVPVMIKSETDVAGFRSTGGRQFHASPFIPHGARECLIPQRLRGAGAVIVATTVMHERGVQPTGYNPWYDGPNNPYALDHFPGGSSSGSAVAVATGMVPVAIGFDGGGSVRIPAAWSGTVGLAVGYTRIPFSSSKANLFSVSKAGPLAATVQDAADSLMLLGQPVTDSEGRQNHFAHVMYGNNGPPPAHWIPRWQSTEAARPKIKIGVFSEWVGHRPDRSGTNTDDAVYQRYQNMLERLSSKTEGPEYQIVEFSIPHMREQAISHGLLIISMFSKAMSKEFFRGTSCRETDDDLYYQPATQIQLKLGQQISAMELLACMRIRSFAVAQWRSVLSETVDVILTPTSPMTAIRRPPGSDVLGFTDSGLFVQMIRYIWPGNLAGLPGLAIPTGVDSQGLPISMQVICTHWHEADCLAVGADIESLYASERPKPPANLWLDPQF